MRVFVREPDKPVRAHRTERVREDPYNVVFAHVEINAQSKTVVPDQNISICVKGIQPRLFGVFRDEHAFCVMENRAGRDIGAGESAAVIDVVVVIRLALHLFANPFALNGRAQGGDKTGKPVGKIARRNGHVQRRIARHIGVAVDQKLHAVIQRTIDVFEQRFRLSPVVSPSGFQVGNAKGNVRLFGKTDRLAPRLDHMVCLVARVRSVHAALLMNNTQERQDLLIVRIDAGGVHEPC